MPARSSTVRDPALQAKHAPGAGDRTSAASSPGPLWSSMALRIEPADSPLERDADNTAERVIQRTCTACEEEPLESKRSIHRQHEGGATDASGASGRGDAVASVLHSDPGQPLDPGARAYFEPRFSQRFDAVRVHTGAAASESARSIHARAYTSGSDIVFREGEFAPGTATGRRLLAHELTHVVQQTDKSARANATRIGVQRMPATAGDSADATSAAPTNQTFFEIARDFCLTHVSDTAGYWEDTHRRYIKPVTVGAGALVTAGKHLGGAALTAGMALLRSILPMLRTPYLWVLPFIKPLVDGLALMMWFYDNSDWIVTQIKTYVGPLIKLGIAHARAQIALGVGLAGFVLPTRLNDHLLGVHRHLDPLLESLGENWWDIITQAALDLIWPWPAIWKQLGSIWDSSKQFAGNLCSLRMGALVDDAIGMWRALNQIFGLLWGYFAMVAAIVGAAIGAGGTPVGSLAGAGVGFALAVKVGMVLLVSTIAAEAAAIGKSAYDLDDADEREATGTLSADEQAALDEEKEEDYKQIAESTLTLSLIAVMMALGQLASRIVSGLRGLFRLKPKAKPPAKTKATSPKPKAKTTTTKKTKGAPATTQSRAVPRKQKIDQGIRQRPDFKKLKGHEIAKLQKLPDAPGWPQDIQLPPALKGQAPYAWAKTKSGNLTLVRTPAGKQMNVPKIVYDPKRGGFVNRTAYVKQKTKPTVPKELELGAAEARRARDRVIGRQGEQDAFASDPDGLETKSGWKNDAQTLADVKALQKRIGHAPEPDPLLDQQKRVGNAFQSDPEVAGRYHSTHAEKKLVTKTSNRRIGVSKEMCLDCQNFFSKLAVAEKQVIVVADPTGLRVFHPNYLTMLLEGATAVPAADIAELTEDSLDTDELAEDDEELEEEETE